VPTYTCTKLILIIWIRPSLLLPLCTTCMYILHNHFTGSGSVTSVCRVSYHSSKLYNLECFEFMFVLECCLFLGRLNCRFRTGVFVVKPRWKTSDYLTRVYLDSNTPLFYSLKQRKKAGFRTQSHITDNDDKTRHHTSHITSHITDLHYTAWPRVWQQGDEGLGEDICKRASVMVL
jgi:hypothetical protein